MFISDTGAARDGERDPRDLPEALCPEICRDASEKSIVAATTKITNFSVDTSATGCLLCSVSCDPEPSIFEESPPETFALTSASMNENHRRSRTT